MSAEHGSSHGHDGPPIPPEPKTPMWLPALGAALFLLAGLWWATRPESPVIAEDTAGAIGDAGAEGGAAPNAQAQAQAHPAMPQGAPGAAGRPGVDASMQMNPEQAAQLQKILQGLGH